SEEHTSELQSLTNLVCRLMLEKKTGLGANLNGFLHAALCLRFGDPAGFAETRDAMLESADREDFFSFVYVLRASVLSPESPEAVSKAFAAWKQKFAELPEDVRFIPFHHYWKGIAHYRLGQYNEALEELQRAWDTFFNWTAPPPVFSILPITHFLPG